MASATAYGQRPKFVRAEYSAMAESENCAYGLTLMISEMTDISVLYPSTHRIILTIKVTRI